MNRRLYRSVRERVLGGVAGGVAEYFDLDPSLVRIAWAILILASGGIFLLLYIVMWIVVPEAPPYAGYGAGQPWPSGAPPVPPAPAVPGEGAAGVGEGQGADAAGVAGAEAGSEGGAAASAPGGAAMPAPGHDDWRHWDRYERRRHRSGGGALVIGALLILVGVWFLARDYFGFLHLPDLWPLLVIALGLLLLYGAVRPRE